MSEISFAFDTNITKKYSDDDADKKPRLDYFELFDAMSKTCIRLYPGTDELNGFAKVKTGEVIGLGRWHDILTEVITEGDNKNYVHDKAPLSEADWILLNQHHFYIRRAGLNVPEDPGVIPECKRPICTLVYNDADKKALRFLSSDYKEDIHGPWIEKSAEK